MGKYKVDFLLIEDDFEEAELTIRSLKKNNILNTIIHIDDGAEALDYLFSRGKFIENNSTDMPRLMLLDLNLPKIGGLEILRQVRDNPHTCMLPIVVLTSSKEEKDLMNCYALGANSYIRKPVNFNQFVEAVRQLGLYWLVLNEPPPVNGRKIDV